MNLWPTPAVVLASALTLAACSSADNGRSEITLPSTTLPTTTTSVAPPPETTPPETTTVLPPTEPPSEPPSTVADGATLAPDDQSKPPPGAGAGDSFYPWLGNSGYDVTHYDLALDVDPNTNTLDGVTTIWAVSTSDLETVYLDLAGLEVDAVTLDGVPTDFDRYRSELVVRPTSPIAASSSFAVEVSYSGTPERISDPGVPFFDIGWFNGDGWVFTANQPSGSMSWYPSNNHPLDKATFTISITVPEHLIAASNGLLVSERVDGGRRTVTWQMDDPMATYLAAVYIGPFERHSQRIRPDLLVRDYIPADLSESERSETLEALSVTAGAIEFFERLVGPYPFDAYGTIVLPVPLGFAMENQTLSVHGADTLDAQIIAHELAHQWFGNSVTAADWSDIWLHEGFAHYLSFLYLAEVGGEDLDELMAQEHRVVMATRAVPPGRIGVAQLFDFNSVYLRSTLTLHALHRHLGDEVFFDLLRRYYDASAGGTATTADFSALVAELGGSAATELLDDWLYDRLAPTSLGG